GARTPALPPGPDAQRRLAQTAAASRSAAPRAGVQEPQAAPTAARPTPGLPMRVRLTQDLLMLVRRTLGLLMPAPRMRVRRPSSSRTTSIAPAGSARTGVSFPDRGTPARLLRGPNRTWTAATRR